MGKNDSVYCRRQLATAVREAGLNVGRDHVARLMRAQGIRGASRARNRFTYCSTWSGVIYVAFDNAVAESVKALYKTELHRNPAALATNARPWRGLTSSRSPPQVGRLVQRGTPPR